MDLYGKASRSKTFVNRKAVRRSKNRNTWQNVQPKGLFSMFSQLMYELRRLGS
jgi:hypothetical protein